MAIANYKATITIDTSVPEYQSLFGYTMTYNFTVAGDNSSATVALALAAVKVVAEGYAGGTFSWVKTTVGTIDTYNITHIGAYYDDTIQLYSIALNGDGNNKNWGSAYVLDASSYTDGVNLLASYDVLLNGTIVMKDATGVYSATHTGGWGNPNPQTSDATDSSLVLHLSDAQTLVPSVDNVIVFDGASTPSFYPSLPSVTQISFDISPTMAGFTNRIPDGIYQLDYFVVTASQTYVDSQYVMVAKNLECCLGNLATKNCGCGNAASRFDKAWALYTQAKYAIQCDNVTEAAELLKAAIEQCDGCSGCN